MKYHRWKVKNMGNYRCYNCNKEFWTIGSQRNHFWKCPAVTEEMKQDALKPYFRVISRIEYIQPSIKGDKEDFQYSMRVTTKDRNYKEKLIEYARDIGISLEARSSEKQKVGSVE